MTCPGNGSPGPVTPQWVFENWSRTHTYTVPIAFRPGTVSELVAAVIAAETDPSGVIRAIGTGWAYPDVAIAPEVTYAVQTDALNRILSGTDPASTATLLPFALNAANRSMPQRFVHVEAGIKIQELNCKLDEMGLALATMGGSNGQSLAGAISTGTHGSDFDVQPLSDLVRAIHLVGPGGQEWWIERSEARAITDRGRMFQARAAGRLCSDIRIVYEDQLFSAVLVSVGRMGVVYSYVVEVVPAFLLQQQSRQSLPWADAAAIIRQRRDSAAATEPRYMEVVVNQYKRTCVITSRTLNISEPVSADDPDAFRFVCDIQQMNAVLAGIAALLPVLVAAATATAIATVSPLWLLIPGAFEIHSSIAITAATAGLTAFEGTIHAAMAAPGSDLAQKLASIVNTFVLMGQKGVVPQLVDALIGFERNPNAPVVVGKSFRLMTGQKECPVMEAQPECLRQINGLEFALDCRAGAEALFGFMDDVFALTDEFLAMNMPQAFGLGLRFVKGTEALIGMQQWSRTCHAEFNFVRGIRGEEDFRKRLYAIAMLHNAIPHWGLIHEIDAQEVARLYGTRLRDWQLALRRLIDVGGGRDGTFSTSFSVERGLEPTARSELTPDISYLVPLLLDEPLSTTDISYVVPLLLSG